MAYKCVHKDLLSEHLAQKLGLPKQELLDTINDYLANKPVQKRTPPSSEIRCMARVWKDGDACQCMSKRVVGDFCKRHAKRTTRPCQYCSKPGKPVTHEFAWQHHGRIDDPHAPSHFLSVDRDDAIPLKTPIICECGQEIAFRRSHCPDCNTPLVCTE